MLAAPLCQPPHIPLNAFHHFLPFKQEILAVIGNARPTECVCAYSLVCALRTSVLSVKREVGVLDWRCVKTRSEQTGARSAQQHRVKLSGRWRGKKLTVTMRLHTTGHWLLLTSRASPGCSESVDGCNGRHRKWFWLKTNPHEEL